jgi:hypothetical protein
VIAEIFLVVAGCAFDGDGFIIEFWVFCHRLEVVDDAFEFLEAHEGFAMVFV